MTKKTYITSAIAYPNGKPHMGHALEIIQTDAIARFYKLLGEDVVFQTGTDEHGIKNWETAKKLGKDVLEMLNENVGVFVQLYKDLSIQYDSFLRTTDKKNHFPGVQKLWMKLAEAGDIYKQKYSGHYCCGCETFKTEKELEDSRCPNHPNMDVKWIDEENYFFRLSKYSEQVARLIESDTYQVIPVTRKNEILSFLKDARDISFSRTKTALPWGIPVPGDEEHVMYVWCDALSNYITGIGYGRDEKQFEKLWPCRVHVVGKDILRFHAAFWPAMLLSAKLALPKKLFVHGFVTFEGMKMSKSAGTAIDPLDQLKKFGVNPFRFYLLASMPSDSDGDYTEESVLEKTNNELTANPANFCYRALSFLSKNFDSRFDEIDENRPLIDEILLLCEKVKEHYSVYNFKEAIKVIMEISSIGNKYLQDREPWRLIKTDKAAGARILGTSVNIAKILSILFYPVMPDFCKEVQRQLNLQNLTWKDINFDTKNHTITDAAIIIQKINKDDLVKHSPQLPLLLKVGKILSVQKHPEAEKLFIEKIDFGSEVSQIVSGLASYYTPEELTGKHVVVVTNLKKAKLRGVESFGMLLAAGDETMVKVLEAPNSAPGSLVSAPGFISNEKQISIDDFAAICLVVKDKRAVFNGVNLKTDSEEVFVDAPDGFKIK